MGSNPNNKIVETELNDTLIHSMINGWVKKDLFKGLDFKLVNFQMECNLFEHMEIYEYIYEVVIETSY